MTRRRTGRRVLQDVRRAILQAIKRDDAPQVRVAGRQSGKAGSVQGGGAVQALIKNLAFLLNVMGSCGRVGREAMEEGSCCNSSSGK